MLKLIDKVESQHFFGDREHWDFGEALTGLLVYNKNSATCCLSLCVKSSIVTQQIYEVLKQIGRFKGLKLVTAWGKFIRFDEKDVKPMLETIEKLDRALLK